VGQLICELKLGQRRVAEFWIDLHDHKIYIRYFGVRDQDGNYLGTLEATQDITNIQQITGQKRLLDTE